MRKLPTYDWLWFETHTPFLKIMEKYCDLSIVKERVPYYVFGCKNYSNHYYIDYSLAKFINNIYDIKMELLKTNICKYNEDVRKRVEEIDTSWTYPENVKDIKRCASFIIFDGCIKTTSGSFHWNIEMPDGIFKI
jgi:hypothetical protein